MSTSNKPQNYTKNDKKLFNRKYPVERKTLNHRIPYYVRENFASEYQGSLGRLESAVEEEYIMNMKRACFSEKNYRKFRELID